MLVFYVTSYTSHELDKSMSVIVWGILRLYVNVEVVWKWPLIDTCQTLKSERRKIELQFNKFDAFLCTQKQGMLQNLEFYTESRL